MADTQDISNSPHFYQQPSISIEQPQTAQQKLQDQVAAYLNRTTEPAHQALGQRLILASYAANANKLVALNDAILYGEVQEKYYATAQYINSEAKINAHDLIKYMHDHPSRFDQTAKNRLLTAYLLEAQFFTDLNSNWGSNEADTAKEAQAKVNQLLLNGKIIRPTLEDKIIPRVGEIEHMENYLYNSTDPYPLNRYTPLGQGISY